MPLEVDLLDLRAAQVEEQLQDLEHRLPVVDVGARVRGEDLDQLLAVVVQPKQHGRVRQAVLAADLVVPLVGPDDHDRLSAAARDVAEDVFDVLPDAVVLERAGDVGEVEDQARRGRSCDRHDDHERRGQEPKPEREARSQTAHRLEAGGDLLPSGLLDPLESGGDGGARLLDPLTGGSDERLLLLALGLRGLEPVPLLGLRRDDVLELLLLVELLLLIELLVLLVEVLIVELTLVQAVVVELVLFDLFLLYLLVIEVLEEVVAELVLLGLVGPRILRGLALAIPRAALLVGAHVVIPGKVLTKPSSA